MFRSSIPAVMASVVLISGCATSSASTGAVSESGSNASRAMASGETKQELKAQDAVIARERAFAKTMADRDFNAFKKFLSAEAIFMSGPKPLRGKQRIADAWKPYFDAAEAPFSWDPDRVVVIDSADLAFSSGPVTGPDGAVIGIFNSVWRLETDGVWRIVFDKGGCACD